MILKQSQSSCTRPIGRAPEASCTRPTEIEHVAWTSEQELRKGMPPYVVEALGVPLGRAKAEEPKPSALAEEPKKEIAPVIIVYDESGDASTTAPTAAPAAAEEVPVPTAAPIEPEVVYEIVD